MDQIYQINPQLHIPIYRQLADAVENAIKTGKLQPEERLPTVQELSETLGIARGTIKRVYDELEHSGLIEKRQGRGTFVSYRPPEVQSRKDRAMGAIDGLLDSLEDMGFSPGEIKIFLDLKLRERKSREDRLKIAVLECNPENLSRMAEQLRSLAQVDVHSYLTETVESYPYKLAEGMDMIVTTLSHAKLAEDLTPDPKKLAKVVLRLSPYCLREIAKLERGTVVGILCSSLRFGEMLRNTAGDYGDGLELLPAESLTLREDPGAYLSQTQALLLPVGYEKYCSAFQKNLLESYKGTVILCGYEMDEGSFLYLQERIKKLKQKKVL
ncbi:MAG: GntR family transcriptional regulator [Oscillospiraceae bacterium]|nr:GntR family transcriptional regulator [Oscillospiraceae bacterium]